MKKILVEFRDEELGNDFVEFTYDETKYDYNKTMELAMEVLYISFSDYSYGGSRPDYKEIKEEYPELTKKLYNICMDVLDEGNYGVITERFCEFMEKAFGWEYRIMNIEADSIFDVENGEWAY